MAVRSLRIGDILELNGGSVRLKSLEPGECYRTLLNGATYIFVGSTVYVFAVIGRSLKIQLIEVSTRGGRRDTVYVEPRFIEKILDIYVVEDCRENGNLISEVRGRLG